MQRVRLALGIGLVVVLAGGLVVAFATQRRGGPPVEAAPVPSIEPSERAASEPSAGPSPVEVPTPDMMGRDFDRIAREMVAFYDWMFENPDAGIENLGLIYHRDCECYENSRTNLQDLADNGLRFDDGGTEVVEVDVVEDFGEVVRLHVVQRRSPQRLVDERGAVQESSDGAGPLTVVYVLEAQADRRWLVRSVEAEAAP